MLYERVNKCVLKGGKTMIYTVTLNPSIDYIVHVDKFREGSLNRSTKDYINIGGKGIMVSKLLKNIGIDNTALGFLGGFTGNHIKEWFRENNFSENFIEVQENTRINVKLKSGEESEINGRGPFISNYEKEKFIKSIGEIKKGDTIIVSGSNAPGLDESIFFEIIKECRKKDADFVIDTTGKALLDSIKKAPLLIKPNIDEFGDLFGKKFNNKKELLPYAKECLDIGAKNVIVSLGKDGAIFFDKEACYYAQRIDGELVNSVGAGDSMIAGFVASIKGGKSSLESFKYSVACGTATAFSQDIASEEKIEEILKKVKIEKI